MNAGTISQTLEELLSSQLNLVIMIAVGLFLAKRGILDKKGRKALSDVSFHLLIPCSILRSYLNSGDVLPILRSSSLLLGVAAAMQILYIVLNKFLYRRTPADHQPLLQYMTLCSNSGFLGVAISQGLYGDLGLLYNSVYMVPQRLFMWSVGMTYFNKKSSGTTIWKALFHPCLTALYLGVFFMVTRISLPAPIEYTVNTFGQCMIPVAMLITGGILADLEFRKFVDLELVYFAAIRLIGLPLIALLGSRLLPMDGAARGISVLMAGMPAATVTVLFASEYGKDARFATRCVVFTTLLSMITIPLWTVILML